jgi:signal transduction histidine kinase
MTSTKSETALAAAPLLESRTAAGAIVPPRERASRRALFAPLGLSGRLLLLTILFALLAEVLIYVPSVANFRRNWLTDRIAAAQIAALVIDAAPGTPTSDDLARRLLMGVGARAVVVQGGGTHRLLTSSDMPPEVSRSIDLRDATWPTLMRDAFATLLSPAKRPIRVVGNGMGGIDSVEIVLDEAPLRAAMVGFSGAMLLVSLLISGTAAGLLYLALQLIIVRPVRRLTGSIAAFAADPEDGSRVIALSGRADEIGVAEEALARMETVLAGELRQNRRLVELGLAVSKINHELRNILTTAQLLTDHLGTVADPGVQRVAPRLVATLARAIDFCEATLAYGRATERSPERRRVQLASVMAELPELGGLAPGAGISIETAIPLDLQVDADPDQLSRVLVNLVRNAVQALAQSGAPSGPPTVRVEASRNGGRVTILVADNGPGIPERTKAHLFAAFQGAARGGTGLGLAISAELVRLHGGSLSLDDTAVGTRFRIVIPDRGAAF